MAGLQVVMVLAWCLPLVLFARNAFGKSKGPADTLRAAVWAVAFVDILFPLRWLAFGGMPVAIPVEQMALWAALYVFSSISAFGLTVAAHNVRQ